MQLSVFLLILAFLCFAADAAGVEARIKLLPLGLAIYMVSLLFSR